MDWSATVPLWVFALFVTAFAMIGAALALGWALAERMNAHLSAQVDALRRYYMAHIVTQKLRAVTTVKRRAARRPSRKSGVQKARVS